MLTSRYTAIEPDFKVAQDALAESKKVIAQFEVALKDEQKQKNELKSLLEKEVHNNKQLLKELARANQTIGKLKGHLEKQTKVVVEQVKTAK